MRTAKEAAKRKADNIYYILPKKKGAERKDAETQKPKCAEKLRGEAMVLS
jgi:hypothetical protein